MKAFKKLLLLTILLGGSSAAAELTVIANASLQNRNFSRKEIRDFYSGIAKTDKYQLLIQPEDRETAQEFEKKFLEKQQSELKATWSIMVFSGSRIPITKDNDQAVWSYVQSHSNSIGYVDAGFYQQIRKSERSDVIAIFNVP